MFGFTALCALLSFSQSNTPSRADQAQEGPTVTMMADEALKLEYAQKRAEVAFHDARFSRDGEFFAVATNAGNIDQVWIYELRSRRLIRFVKSNGPDPIDVAWSENGTLYVMVGDAERYIAGRPGSAPQDVRELPSEMKEIFAHSSNSRLFHCCAEKNDRYTVEVVGRGHNSVDLLMRRSNEKRSTLIEGGGPELMSFLFDPVSSRVVYPVMGGINVFDLQTRQRSTLLKLNNAFNVNLLDWTLDRKRLAYVEYGGCLWEAQPPVESQPPVRIRAAPPQYVCFVDIK
jgi:hypothetical protein